MPCSSQPQERKGEEVVDARFLGAFAMVEVQLEVSIAGAEKVLTRFHQGQGLQKSPCKAMGPHLLEPHGLQEFLDQASRMGAFEWPAALRERHLEAQQLRLVVEVSDTYSYDSILKHGILPKFLWAELENRNCTTARLATKNPALVRRSGNFII